MALPLKLLLSARLLMLVRGDGGIITTVAGTGWDGFSGDGGAATSAALDDPDSVVLNAAGDLLISDRYNHRIRRVAAVTGVITTIAGTGAGTFGGDGGPATGAHLFYPAGLALAAGGDLYITDEYNCRIRRVAAATGTISTVAGGGVCGFSGDGGAATSAVLNYPKGVAVDPVGNVFIADFANHRVRKVFAATSVITTIAGTGAVDFSGDSGAGTSASLYFPARVCVDSRGNVIITEMFGHRVRRVAAGMGVISTLAGTGAGLQRRRRRRHERRHQLACRPRGGRQRQRLLQRPREPPST